MPNPETTCKDPQIWAIPSLQQQSTVFNRAFYFAFSANVLLASQNNLTNSPLHFHLVRDRLSVVSPPLPGNSTADRILQLVLPGSEDLNSGQVFSFTPSSNHHQPSSKLQEMAMLTYRVQLNRALQTLQKVVMSMSQPRESFL